MDYSRKKFYGIDPQTSLQNPTDLEKYFFSSRINTCDGVRLHLRFRLRFPFAFAAAIAIVDTEKLFFIVKCHLLS